MQTHCSETEAEQSIFKHRGSLLHHNFWQARYCHDDEASNYVNTFRRNRMPASVERLKFQQSQQPVGLKTQRSREYADRREGRAAALERLGKRGPIMGDASITARRTPG